MCRAGDSRFHPSLWIIQWEGGSDLSPSTSWLEGTPPSSDNLNWKTHDPLEPGSGRSTSSKIQDPGGLLLPPGKIRANVSMPLEQRQTLREAGPPPASVLRSQSSVTAQSHCSAELSPERRQRRPGRLFHGRFNALGTKQPWVYPQRGPIPAIPSWNGFDKLGVLMGLCCRKGLFFCSGEFPECAALLPALGAAGTGSAARPDPAGRAGPSPGTGHAEPPWSREWEQRAAAGPSRHLLPSFAGGGLGKCKGLVAPALGKQPGAAGAGPRARDQAGEEVWELPECPALGRRGFDFPGKLFPG